MTSGRAAAQHLRDLAPLCGVRDRIDREYAQPLNVEALARDAYISAGHFSRQFRLTHGESPYGYVMTRRIEPAIVRLRRANLSGDPGRLLVTGRVLRSAREPAVPNCDDYASAVRVVR